MRILAIAIALAACAPQNNPQPMPPAPLPSTGYEPPPVFDAGPHGEDGTSCLSSMDCQSGVCEGEGCSVDAPGICVPRERSCTKDLREYCGCDGLTFQASGSCPGQRFSARGACVLP